MENLVCSPMGLVPKDKNNNQSGWRLITHLSYPRGNSVNSFIPKQFASVQYATFEDAVNLCIAQGKGCFMSKSDLKSAFRHLPIHPDDIHLLGFQAFDKFFIDARLPFGLASAPALFERVSKAIHWIVERDSGKIVHYLDDYFFCNKEEDLCTRDFKRFQQVCEHIGMPIAHEKSEGPAQRLSFLGLELDSEAEQVKIPISKIQRAASWILRMLEGKKTKVKYFQRITGYLNFLTNAIPQARAFIRKMYDAMGGLPDHYHLTISYEIRADLKMWLYLLATSDHNRPFLARDLVSNHDLELHTDASGVVGFGCWYGKRGEWAQGYWPQEILDLDPSIELLELFGLYVAFFLWAADWKNSGVLMHCDNSAVVQMLRKRSTKAKGCMVLVRKITVICIQQNINLQVRHIPGEKNSISDALSRFQMDRFRSLTSRMGRVSREGKSLPQCLWLTLEDIATY